MAQDTSRHIAFGIYQWTADYPDPSNFFDTLLNGRRIAALYNNDLSLFDDSRVNEAIERAMATADDSLRARRWTDVDRAVMEQAPVVVLTHPYEARLYAPRLGGWYRHITRILKLEDLYVKPTPPPPALAAARAADGRSIAPRPANARGTSR